jgi:uncharacterized protein YkwD
MRIALGLAVLALAAPAGASAATCSRADLAPSASGLAAARATTLCLVNDERTSHGLRPLSSNPRLVKAAREHSRDMVARHYFDHVAPGGSDLVTRLRHVHYISRRISWAIGENIAWGTGSDATPQAIVEAWMESPGHRANILSTEFREAGIGVEPGLPETLHEPGATYTLDFGRRGR